MRRGVDQKDLTCTKKNTRCNIYPRRRYGRHLDTFILQNTRSNQHHTMHQWYTVTRCVSVDKDTCSTIVSNKGMRRALQLSRR